MRSAPSVTYPVGLSAFQGRLLIGLSLVGAVAWWLWWWLSALPSPWLAVLGGAGWLLWSALAWRSWRGAPVGQLQWDPQAPAQPGRAANGVWRWLDADGSVRELERLVWALDAQGVVLLRLQRGRGPGRWAWLEAQRDPRNWDALRRALQAHAR